MPRACLSSRRMRKILKSLQIRAPRIIAGYQGKDMFVQEKIDVSQLHVPLA